MPSNENLLGIFPRVRRRRTAQQEKIRAACEAAEIAATAARKAYYAASSADEAARLWADYDRTRIAHAAAREAWIAVR